jgi:hypothetical protein
VNMTVLELRGATRYRMAASVEFWWPTQKGTIRASRGVTRDMSNCGVMILSDHCPPVGAAIQLKVSLPSRQGRDHGMELEGDGVVVRVQTSDASSPLPLKSGFAASVHLYPALPEDEKHLN